VTSPQLSNDSRGGVKRDWRGKRTISISVPFYVQLDKTRRFRRLVFFELSKEWRRKGSGGLARGESGKGFLIHEQGIGMKNFT